MPDQPVEQAEDAIAMFHVEADAVVGDRDADAARQHVAPDPDGRRNGIPRVLDRVVDQIGQRLRQPPLPRGDPPC